MPATSPRNFFSFLRLRRNRRRSWRSTSNHQQSSQYDSIPYQMNDNNFSHAQTNQFVTFRAPSLHATRDCPICLEQFADQYVTTGQCLHLVHSTCLMRWLSQDPQVSCPVCRHPLVSDHISSNTDHRDEAETTSDANSDLDSIMEPRAINFNFISDEFHRWFVDVNLIEDEVDEELDLDSVDGLVEGESWPNAVVRALTFDNHTDDDFASEDLSSTSEEETLSSNDDWSDDEYVHSGLDPCWRSLLTDLESPSQSDELLNLIRDL